MVKGRPGRLQEDGQTALSLMEQALGLLDSCDSALDVGAHLDLAICRLRDHLRKMGIDFEPTLLRSAADQLDCAVPDHKSLQA